MTVAIDLNIARLREEDNFERLFKALYNPLLGFANKYLSDHESAEEVVQEVFSQLWAKSSDLEIRTNLKSYLYGAVRNGCLNTLKHRKVIQAHEGFVKSRGEHSAAIDFLEIDELQAKITKALDRLPDKCRQIFELSRFEEKKYKEIASELDISVKTVETQMSRALKVMRQELGQYLALVIVLFLYLINRML